MHICMYVFIMYTHTHTHTHAQKFFSLALRRIFLTTFYFEGLGLGFSV
jgi:hypothetical protein